MQRRGARPPVPPSQRGGFFADMPTSSYQQGEGVEGRYLYGTTSAGLPLPPPIRARNRMEGRNWNSGGAFRPQPLGLRRDFMSASQPVLFQPALGGRGSMAASSLTINRENPRPTLGQHSQSTLSLPQHTMRLGASRWTSWAELDRCARPGREHKICNFCKSNKEPYFVYSTHNLRDSNGKLTCPVLRRYTCRHCGATGDDAHTDSYCPYLPEERRLNVKSYLWTRRTSAGAFSRRGKR